MRLSGPAALSALLRLCPELEKRPPVERKQSLLRIHHPDTGELLDRALVTYFPAPRSYTGEEVAEIATHGGTIAPELVLDALVAVGVRPAGPGEFTRRAVLNGKLDLLQAEAILDLTDGRSPALHRAAVHQMEGALSERIEDLRRLVLQAEALVGYGIDFPDEDEPPVAPERIQKAVSDALGQVELILATAPEGEMLRRGALVVLAGLPNSGKSSLFNALLGTERAIVTDVPGTTRDAVEADATINGYPFRLVDTAGLRETPDRVEAIGVEVARRYLSSADIVVFCSDASRLTSPDEADFLRQLENPARLLVRTKADLDPGGEDQIEPGSTGGLPQVRVSVRTGQGLADLKELLLNSAFSSAATASPDTPIVTNRRHRRELQRAADELRLYLQGAEESLPAELAATHLRSAAGALEDLIGVITPDDLLGAIFTQFCVGK